MDLQALSAADVLREAVAVSRDAPRTFASLALAVIFPLSFSVLAQSLFIQPLLLHLRHNPSAPAADWILLLNLFVYLLFFFTFSLSSTAAIVFTVASLYAAKPVSFASSLAAVRPIFPRLFRTFLWSALLMFLYILAHVLVLLPLLLFPSSPLVAFLIALALALLAGYVYISALWRLASVVSVLEPLCDLAAIAKSRDLLRGRVRMAAALVLAYTTACCLVLTIFRAVVVKGPREEEGSLGVTSVIAKVLIGVPLVAFIRLLLLSLFFQSVGLSEGKLSMVVE